MYQCVDETDETEGNQRSNYWTSQICLGGEPGGATRFARQNVLVIWVGVLATGAVTTRIRSSCGVQRQVAKGWEEVIQERVHGSSQDQEMK